MTATIIPLHPRPTPTATACAYWMSGGDLFRNVGGKGVHMTTAEARRRRYQHEQEAIRHHGDRDVHAARQAAALWGQITRALDDLDRWNRAVGKPSPYDDPRAEAHGRFVLASEMEGK